jgi:DNA-binding IclR family transcriptional regulator
MSSTVAKALAMLDHFSEDEPELGLSELARRAGADKATVHRMLAVMADAGIVEQRSDTKFYRLGAGVLRLARVREHAFPVTSIYQAALDRLMAETEETAHASLISGRALATIAVRESTRGSRVSLVAGDILPFHSTASGIAILAFCEKKLRDRVLASQLEARTAQTLTQADAIQQQINRSAERGYSMADQTNEDDVYGIAAPVFDQAGYAVGAVAVATPAHRMTDSLRGTIIAGVMREAGKVTFETGGRIPSAFAQLISQNAR